MFGDNLSSIHDGLMKSWLGESLVRWQQSISHVLSTVPLWECLRLPKKRSPPILKVTPHQVRPHYVSGLCCPAPQQGWFLFSGPFLLGVGPWWSSTQTSFMTQGLEPPSSPERCVGRLWSLCQRWLVVQLILHNVFKVAWNSPWIVKK